MPLERLTSEQVERYQAHLTLPDFGPKAQRRLLDSRVLVLGVGGLGCPAAQYLVAAGVGALGLLDDDLVDGTNLQRQVLFGDADGGRPKVEAAAERLAAMNPGCEITPIPERLVAGNARRLLRDWDLVLDGSDNFATRYVCNDASVLAGVPLITGSLYQYEGQVTVIHPPDTPCYRCTFPAPPPEHAACREVGVLGPLAGLVGTIMASEAVKLVGLGASALFAKLQLIDAQSMSFRQVELRRDPDCPLCGETPTIDRPTAVTAHAASGS